MMSTEMLEQPAQFQARETPVLKLVGPQGFYRLPNGQRFLCAGFIREYFRVGTPTLISLAVSPCRSRGAVAITIYQDIKLEMIWKLTYLWQRVWHRKWQRNYGISTSLPEWNEMFDTAEERLIEATGIKPGRQMRIWVSVHVHE